MHQATFKRHKDDCRGYHSIWLVQESMQNLPLVQNVQLTGFVPKMAHVDNPIVGFSEEDVRHLDHPHDDALVVSIRVGDYNTHQVLVNNGS